MTAPLVKGLNVQSFQRLTMKPVVPNRFTGVHIPKIHRMEPKVDRPAYFYDYPNPAHSAIPQ
jgi:hypothetical protein